MNFEQLVLEIAVKKTLKRAAGSLFFLNPDIFEKDDRKHARDRYREGAIAVRNRYIKIVRGDLYADIAADIISHAEGPEYDDWVKAVGEVQAQAVVLHIGQPEHHKLKDNELVELDDSIRAFIKELLDSEMADDVLNVDVEDIHGRLKEASKEASYILMQYIVGELPHGKEVLHYDGDVAQNFYRYLVEKINKIIHSNNLMIAPLSYKFEQ
jgi:hypothetical protein